MKTQIYDVLQLKIAQKYSRSKLIQTYTKMQGTINDFFPCHIQSEDITIFRNQAIFAARVIELVMYLLKPFYLRKNIKQISLYCENSNTTDEKQKKLDKIDYKQKIELSGWNFIQQNMVFVRKNNEQSNQQQINCLIKQFFQFLQLTGLLCNALPNNKSNFLMTKKSYLRQIQYQKRFIHDISRLTLNQPNYQFYTKNLKIRSSRISISDLHHKKENYYFLEITHDYIQWMFPNHYASRFNSDSYALSYVEAELFYLSQQIGLAMLQSISMFFDFMGIKMSRIDGCLTLLSRKRLVDVLIHNTHNHLRIMRVLACLSITGFRVIALNLIEFLRYAVNQDVQLKSQKYVFERDWQIYDDNHFDKAKKMSFIADDKFKPDHCSIKKYFQMKKVGKFEKYQDDQDRFFITAQKQKSKTKKQKPKDILIQQFDLKQIADQMNFIEVKIKEQSQAQGMKKKDEFQQTKKPKIQQEKIFKASEKKELKKKQNIQIQIELNHKQKQKNDKKNQKQQIKHTKQQQDSIQNKDKNGQNKMRNNTKIQEKDSLETNQKNSFKIKQNPKVSVEKQNNNMMDNLQKRKKLIIQQDKKVKINLDQKISIPGQRSKNDKNIIKEKNNQNYQINKNTQNKNIKNNKFPDIRKNKKNKDKYNKKKKKHIKEKKELINYEQDQEYSLSTKIYNSLQSVLDFLNLKNIWKRITQ